MLLYCKISIVKVEKWMSECKLLNGKLKFKYTAHLWYVCNHNVLVFFLSFDIISFCVLFHDISFLPFLLLRLLEIIFVFFFSTNDYKKFKHFECFFNSIEIVYVCIYWTYFPINDCGKYLFYWCYRFDFYLFDAVEIMNKKRQKNQKSKDLCVLMICYSTTIEFCI